MHPDSISSAAVSKSYMLTNIGHKRLRERQNNWCTLSHGEKLMAGLCKKGLARLSNSNMVEQLLSLHWIEEVPERMTPDEALLRYSRNPLQNITKGNYEITTLCNFTCLHCRNGGITKCSETNIALLMETADLLLSIGVRRFDFIGGEVTKFGNGWLDLAQHIADHNCSLDWDQPLVTTVYTNGWWLDQRDFEASGVIYPDDMSFMQDMRNHGITHVLFSIDGPEEIHDQWRGHKGLYRRIFSGIAKVRRVGLTPRISAVTRPHESVRHLRPFSRRMYGAENSDLRAMFSDPTNAFSNFVDTARGADLRKGDFKLSKLHSSLIRCKAFFRPWPTIRILASGAIGICPLMQGQEGYGNIHERPLPELLNRLQETPLYKLHATGHIADYLNQINPAEFGETYDHLCSIRRAVNLCAIRDTRRIEP